MIEINKLIKQHKNKLTSLEKRINVTLGAIQREEEKAEKRIDTTLGEKYRRLSDEHASHYRGLNHLLLAKEGARRAKK